jgi:hypothetical protein
MPEKMRALWKGTMREDGTPVEYVQGVPAQHLTNDDYEALSPEQKKALADSGLYEVRTAAEMSGAASSSPTAAQAAQAAQATTKKE